MLIRYFILIFFMFSFSACRPEREVKVIKVGLTHGRSHSFSQALDRFSELLSERSNGRYQVDIFHSAQIGNEKEMQEMLTIGSLEICLSGVLNTYEPLFTLFEMPYLYRDREHVINVNNGPVMQEVDAIYAPTFVMYLAAFMVILVMLFVNQKQRRALKQQSRPAWLMLSVVSVFLVVGHVCRFTALKYSPVSVVQPLIATIVIFVLLFSWIINRKIDYFNWQVIVGIFLVLAGVFTIYGWFS